MRVSLDQKLYFWTGRVLKTKSWIMLDVESGKLSIDKSPEQPDCDLAIEVPYDVDGARFATEMGTIRRLGVAYCTARQIGDAKNAAEAEAQIRDVVAKAVRFEELTIDDFLAKCWEGWESQFETACKQWDHGDFEEHVLTVCDKLLWNQSAIVDKHEFLQHYRKFWTVYRTDRDSKVDDTLENHYWEMEERGCPGLSY